MSSKKKSRTDNRQQYFELLGYTTVGIEMGVAVGIGVFLGYAFDFWLFDGKTAPWGILFFMAMGVAAGGKALMHAANELRERARKAEDDGDQDKP